MRHLTNIALALALVLALAGCVTVTAPDPETSAYFATRLAVRFDAVPLDKLQAAQPHLQAAYDALGAEDETALDLTIGEYLDGYLDAIEPESDRELVREVVEALLAQIRLKDPDVLDSREVEIVRSVLGGILDAIASAEGRDTP